MQTSKHPVGHAAFADAPRFCRAATRAMAAGALAGVACAAAGAPLFPLVIFAVAVATAPPGPRPAVAAGGAGMAIALLPIALSDYPTFATAVAGAGLGILWSRFPVPAASRSMRLAVVLAAGAAAVVGAWTTSIFSAHQALAHGIPDPVFGAGLGAALALILATSAAPGHLVLARDPVTAGVERATPQLGDELAELVRRGHESYLSAGRAAARRAAAHEGQESGAGDLLDLGDRLRGAGNRVLDLARRCQTLDDALGDDAQNRLARRLEELDERASRSDDTAAAEHYARARAALKAQIAQLSRIRDRRERIVALIHEQLALLERARLSLIGLESADSSVAAGELDVVARDLDGAAEQMEAMMSLEADEAAPGVPTAARSPA